ncbi:MAG: hypothetical protein WAM79_13170 [Candidatus Sulfotelmatobacter sp.]
MSAGFRFKSVVGVVFLSGAILCAAPVFAKATSTHSQHKPKKPPPPPPLPSGPTGVPVQQMPLDSIAAVPPKVTYENNQLTIVARNSTLSDILRAVRKETGAQIDVPVAPERVVTTLGPGPARDVLSDLLNGSRFNYVLLGAPGNETVLTRVVLVPKSNVGAAEPAAAQQQAAVQGAPAAPPPDADASADAADADTPDDSSNAVDDSADQNASDDQSNQEQPAVKTPQQMLQEMQQRQLQLQQQQPAGQPPIPGSGMPPHSPQQQ